MKMNEVIRTYRKEQKLTQEQLAMKLGVSAPAVNKWENGNSYPDIMLLAPLARALKINIDTLLSFEEELSTLEIGQFINELSANITEHGFEDTFAKAERKINQFPNCNQLILWSAQILYGYLVMKIQDVPMKEQYMEIILRWFEQVAFCDDAELAKAAQISLIQNLMKNKQFEEAQKLLDAIPPVGFDKRTTQVQLFVEEEKFGEAFTIQDELLFQQANTVSSTLIQTMMMLCKQNQYEEALKYADLASKFSELFELGTYVSNSTFFTIYAEMENKEQSLLYLKKMLSEFESMRKPRQSDLYRHMKFNKDDGIEQMKMMMVKSLDTDPSLDFLREEEEFKEIIEAYLI